ncbi:glycosyltransferase [Latilactobacillus sakei subsp. sakei]|uniref:glycosyltransferase n=1 Tax=Latilactobacillus sakei TaxID=1599 RepID=UPI00207461BD|nr:glycosyltransferase [Latilactobacillus sakei]MDR7923971.1 glycosyltransferase [Latilactobacillus sakei subsp. sakei]USF96794.1 hypothetical protein A4W82_08190 [Latilactobacillus sakei]
MIKEVDLLFSIIVPVYNVEKYLDHCVKSIIANKTQNKFEILLIDDGSMDSSGEICDDYADRFDNITSFHTKNGGLSAARNFGLDKARGKYVCFIDSDDWVRQDMLSQFERICDRHNNIDLIAYDFLVVDETGDNKEKKYSFAERALNNNILNGTEAVKALFDGSIRSYAVMFLYKKSLFYEQNVRFPVGRNYEDVATTYKLLFLSENVYFLNEKLYFYVQREGSISHVDRISDVQAIMQNNKEINAFFEDYRSDSDFYNLLKVFQIQKIFTGYRISVNIDSVEARKFEKVIRTQILKNSNSLGVLKKLPRKQLLKVWLLRVNLLKKILRR